MLARLAHATRQAVGAFRRSYDAAGASGRWPLSAANPAPVSAALAARGPIGQRAAYLFANSPYATAYVETLVTNLVGDGPSVRSGHPDAGTRKTLEQAFLRFYATCDAEGVSDLTGFLGRVVRSWAVAGEAFVYLGADPATIGLRLRLLSPEQIDPALSRDLGDGRRIVSGIELDGADRRIAYHVLPERPDLPFAAIRQPVRVPAEDICHLFEASFPGQVRGVSRLAPIATRCLEVDKLEDALLARFNTAALFGGFVKDMPDDPAFPELTGAATDLSLEPGVMRRLPVGSDVVFPNVPDANGAPDFLRHMVRSIATGGGVPYELISADLSQVNYSSARLGLEQFKRRVRALQRSLLTARLIEPVWARMVTLEALAGRIDFAAFEADPSAFYAVSAMWPEWASLDPVKETAAEVEALNANLRSRFEIIASRGRDPQEVDAEIRADRLRVTAPAPEVQTRDA